MYKPLTCGCYWVFNFSLLNLHGVKDFFLLFIFVLEPTCLVYYQFSTIIALCYFAPFELCCIFFKQLLCFFPQIYYSKQHIVGIVAGFVLLVLVCYPKHGV
jgi:hypothetical protein